MTTKYNEVNVRNGPGLNHLKVYKIFRKGYPLKVTKEFENWKKVSDYRRELGWVSNSQLTEKKSVIVTIEEDFIFKFPDEESKKIAVAKKDFILKCERCENAWCLVDEMKIKGWVRKKSVWGF